MSIELVKIIPLCKRARNRVQEHGEVMELVKRGTFAGDKAVLVRSLRCVSHGTGWWGWFTENEAKTEPSEGRKKG